MWVTYHTQSHNITCKVTPLEIYPHTHVLLHILRGHMVAFAAIVRLIMALALKLSKWQLNHKTLAICGYLIFNNDRLFYIQVDTVTSAKKVNLTSKVRLISIESPSCVKPDLVVEYS